MLSHLPLLKSQVEVHKALDRQLCYADPWVSDKVFSQDSGFPRWGWIPQRRWEERRLGHQLGVCHYYDPSRSTEMQLGLLEDSLHTEESIRVPGVPMKGFNIVGPQIEQEVWGPEHLKLRFLGQTVNGKSWTECLTLNPNLWLWLTGVLSGKKEKYI